MYCVICKMNVSMRALGPTTIAKIRLRTDCCNAFPQFFKYGMGAKFQGNESSMERKFLRHLLLKSESSMERKFLDFSLHGRECSRERKFHGNRSLQKVQGHRARVGGLAPLIQGDSTAGGDMSANKWTSERNDAKPVISANTGHRATFWVRNINIDPPLAELIIPDFETI